ncbi:MAG: hypothetical protein GWN58_62035, partial [Anaerolineae bacterium]|nr:hypothetical protein [Anaerolineae bacterium]
APAAATIAAGQSISYTLTATDALGNDWDATSSASYTVAPGAEGVWTGNVYTGEKDGTWTVTTTYAALADTGVLTVTNVTPTAVISASSTGDEGEGLDI